MKFLIVCPLLFLAILGSAVANGAKVELVRTIPYSPENLKEDIQKNVLEMTDELGSYGCLVTRWVPLVDFGESERLVLVIVMDCVRWQKGNSNAPTRK